MSVVFIETDGGPLEKEEAALLAGVSELPFWPVLQRLLNQMRGDEVSIAMGEKVTPEAAQYARGRYGALADVDAMLGRTIREAYLARIRGEAQTPPPGDTR